MIFSREKRFNFSAERKYAWILFFLFVSGLSNVRAAENPDSQRVRFRTLSWSGKVQGLMVASGTGSEAEWLQVKAVSYLRSRFIEVFSGPDLVFYRWETLEDGTQVPVEDGRVNITGMGETLLILITQQGGKRKYFAMPESLEAFPDDSYRFMNASQMAVVVGVGEEHRVLGLRQVVTISPELETGSVGVVVQLGGQVDGEPRLLYSNRLAHRSGQRTLFFIIDSRRGNVPVEVKRLVEGSRQISRPDPSP